MVRKLDKWNDRNKENLHSKSKMQSGKLMLRGVIEWPNCYPSAR